METVSIQKDFTLIKNFEDACSDQGISTTQTEPQNSEEEIAAAKLKVIAKSLGGYDNSIANKYTAWFKHRNSKGFVCTGAHCSHDGDVRIPLLSRIITPTPRFATTDIARYYGKQFIDLHRVLLKVKNANRGR